MAGTLGWDVTRIFDVFSDAVSKSLFARELALGVAKKISGTARLDVKAVKDVDWSAAGIVSSAPADEIAVLLDTGYVPKGRAVPPWKIEFPILWNENPFKDRNWMFHVHSLRFLDPFIQRFEKEDLDFIVRVLEDFWSFSLLKNTEWVWYDMATGLRAVRLAAILIKAKEKGYGVSGLGLSGLLVSHFEHLTCEKELSRGNHALFQMDGLKALTWALEDFSGYDVGTAKAYAMKKFEEMIRKQIHHEGFHMEDSPEYHFFATATIKRLVKQPWWSGELSEDVGQLLIKAESLFGWLVDPCGQVIPAGDSFKGIARKKLPELDLAPGESKQNAVAYRKIGGYGIARSPVGASLSSSFFLFFQGSFYSGAHKHSDCLSFVWQEKGQDIFVDGGKYGYQEDKWRAYFLSGRAHNTLQVDGQDSSREYEDVYGSSILSVEEVGGEVLLRGLVEHKTLKVRHERSLLFSPGKQLVVTDKVVNLGEQKNRSVLFWWNFAPEFEIVEAQGGFLGRNNQKNMDLKLFFESPGFQDATIYRGYDGEPVAAWLSNEYLKKEPITAIKTAFVLNDVLELRSVFSIASA